MDDPPGRGSPWWRTTAVIARTAADTIYGVRLSAPESTPLDEMREPVTTAATSLCPTGVTCVRG